ncbi:hypothetical protein LZC95_27450 [Pendulispora brunnea]|uniref:Intradiol ring-cleavage dioxygenases domain-containing protein n=1 Tax=Pendulispora brunnea TaxID=2905690 RepID=A0ABZ2JZJ5_9BACT
MARAIDFEKIGRRAALGLFGGTAAALVADESAHGAPGTATSCVLTPNETAGPFFVDERLERSDIRSDPTDGTVARGIPLHLALVVSSLRKGTCTPLSGAMVDIWHCNAVGKYSDVEDDTRGKKFLRGYQRTDGQGRVAFVTIYPGWYPGRAVHVHFKVRTSNSKNAAVSEFASQLYFDDATTNRVFADPRYAHAGKRMKNTDDGLFMGKQLLLDAQPDASGTYSASFSIGLQID